MPKPDLSMYSPGIREAIINRRAKKLAEHGKPTEIWDPKNARLVDRSQFIAEAVASGIAEAMKPPAARGAVITEIAPVPGAPVRESAPPAPSTVPAKPYHEMSSEEFRGAAGIHLDRIFEAHPTYVPSATSAPTETGPTSMTLDESRAAWGNLLGGVRPRGNSPFWSAILRDTESNPQL
jgi:hypothetical protein